MKAVLKSLAAGVVGTGLFFCFFMLVSIPVMTVVARLHGTTAPLEAPDVVIAPAAWFRKVGLPLSAVAFVVSFVLGMRKFRKEEPAGQRPVPHGLLGLVVRVVIVTVLFTILGFALGGLIGIVSIVGMNVFLGVGVSPADAIRVGVFGAALGMVGGVVAITVSERRERRRAARRAA